MKMVDAAKLDNIILYNMSAFRSYDYQENLYNRYIKRDGKEAADKYSARPGYSEHQTGLAFDLIQPNGALLESPNEAQWVAQNAHKYGFIVRYQSGKEKVTYVKMTPEKAKRVVEEHIKNGKPVAEFTMKENA